MIEKCLEGDSFIGEHFVKELGFRKGRVKIYSPEFSEKILEDSGFNADWFVRKKGSYDGVVDVGNERYLVRTEGTEVLHAETIRDILLDL